MPKYYKSQPGDTRPQLMKAVDCIIDRYKENFETTSIFIPPRVGKSTVIRAASCEIVKGFDAATSLLLVPWKNLARQIFDHASVRDEAGRYGWPDVKIEGHQVKRFTDHRYYTISPAMGNYTLCSMTMGLALRNRDAFLDGIECASADGAVRVPVFADESHLMKQAKPYGDLLKQVIERGGYVVTLTGTPWTSDKSRLFGFRFRKSDDYSGTKKTFSKKWTDEAGQRWAMVSRDEYQGEVGNWEADFSISYEEAYDMKAMHEINHVEIDAEVSDRTNNVTKALSEISFGSEDFSLRDVLQTTQVTVDTAKKTIDKLNEWRAYRDWDAIGMKKPVALVVTGADNGSDSASNYHARELRRELQLFSENGYNIEVATSVDDYGAPDKKSEEKIRAFKDGKPFGNQEESIDILIVKMMGIVGLDMPNLKVEAFLSPLRNGPMAAQGITRVCTKWNDIERPADLILPADKAMRDLANNLLKTGITDAKVNTGYLAGEQEPEKINQTEVEIAVSNCFFHSSDHTGDRFDCVSDEMSEKLRALKHRTPAYAAHSDPFLLREIQSGHICVTPDDVEQMKRDTATTVQSNGFEFSCMDEDVDDARGVYVDRAKEETNVLLRDLPSGTGATYGYAHSRLLSNNAKMLGFPKSVKDWRDPKMFKRATDNLPAARKIVSDKFKQG